MTFEVDETAGFGYIRNPLTNLAVVAGGTGCKSTKMKVNPDFK